MGSRMASWWTAVGIAMVCAGCAAAPAGPRGPLLGRGIEAATDLSFTSARGDATLMEGTTTTGRAADTYVDMAPVIPRRLEARISPVSWADIGGQLGWLDGGADIRVGLPASDRWPLAVDLAAGFATGRLGPFHDTKLQRSRWLRLEVYPRLSTGEWGTSLVLALGLNVGDFYHELPDPTPPEGTHFPTVPASVNLIRQETRLEGSLGLFFLSDVDGAFSLLITASPYKVLDVGAIGPACGDCLAEIATYRESWGVVLVSRFAFRYGF
jgi:hypothetical protein